MLEVKNIVTEIETQEGTIKAVDDLTLTIAPREIYALVGESGCGKSMTALSLFCVCCRRQASCHPVL